MSNVLEVDSIYKTINSRRTLSDIYLKCETGEILGIFGRNGSGKSTLMKIIFGTQKAENKCIRINKTLYQKPYATFGMLAYLPQHHFLPKGLSVKKACSLYLNAEIVTAASKDETIRNHWNSKIRMLSGGELRYLEIYLILKSATKFALLDEPLNTLSPKMKINVINLIKEASNEKGIILTDHDYRNLESTVTKTYLMSEGSIKLVRNRKDLIFWKYLPENYFSDIQ